MEKETIIAWKNYNQASTILTERLKRSANIVGEFAEALAHKHYGGTLEKVSKSSFDINVNGTKYQVKSRRIEKIQSTQLSAIRSKNFDYLVVILFDREGNVLKALEINRQDVSELNNKEKNEHVNGWLVNTNKKLLEHENAKDLTQEFRNLLN